MTPEQEQSILSAIDRALAAERRDPLIRLVREIFDSYGGKSGRVVNSSLKELAKNENGLVTFSQLKKDFDCLLYTSDAADE